MHRPPISPHSLGDRFGVEDRPSPPVTFPFVWVARCRVCVFFQSAIRAEFSNALQSLEYWVAQLRETRDLI